MSIVNVKVKYIRPLGYQDLRDWMSDPNNVYIGRRGIVFIDGCRFPHENSIFANPFKIGRDGDRNDVLIAYENYIKEKLASDPQYKQCLLELKGKNLGCWCKPEPCHGDILIKLLNLS